MNWQPNPALYLSPEMMAELALGVDPPLQIAQKYGMSAAEFGQLNAQAWFGEAVYRKREELQASGVTFVTKASMMAEEMWQDIFTQSKTTDMRMEHRIAAAKELTDISGLKPKAAAHAGAGPSFTINIQLPAEAQAPSRHVLETRTVEKAEPMIIDMTPVQAIPPKPDGLRIPDFKLTDDLVGARPA